MAPRFLGAAVACALAGQLQAQTSVVQNLSELSIVTNDSNQSVRVEVGPTLGEARLYGFQGVEDGTTFVGVNSLVIATGAGEDFVEVQVETSESFAVAVDTGLGAADTKVIWRVQPIAQATLNTIRLSSVPGGSQVATIDAESRAPLALWDIDTGNADTVDAKVVSDDPGNFFVTLFDSNAPRLSFEATSNSFVTGVGITGQHGDQDDKLVYDVKQLSPGYVLVDARVDTGLGNDDLELVVDSPGSATAITGRLDAGAGTDRLYTNAKAFSTVAGLDLIGGDGNDDLEVFVSGFFGLSPLYVTNLFGGAGDDQLRLRTDSAIVGSGQPDDLIPLIDGGPGFDLHDAFGQIVNCEGTL